MTDFVTRERLYSPFSYYDNYPGLKIDFFLSYTNAGFVQLGFFTMTGFTVFLLTVIGVEGGSHCLRIVEFKSSKFTEFDEFVLILNHLISFSLSMFYFLFL